jgi:predicted nucleic acid-binding protein
MEIFHLVIDTSMLRRLHFRHPDFQRLLLRSQMGSLKIYIPYIAIEEERTAQLMKHVKAVEEMQSIFAKLQRGVLGMLVEGLPAPHM